MDKYEVTLYFTSGRTETLLLPEAEAQAARAWFKGGRVPGEEEALLWEAYDHIREFETRSGVLLVDSRRVEELKIVRRLPAANPLGAALRNLETTRQQNETLREMAAANVGA